MNEKALINFLWKYGYFWKYDSGKDLNESAIESIHLSHPAVVDAVRAWQEADANFDLLARVVHNRGVIADGGVGPVTEAMLSVPRCDVPDFQSPETVYRFNAEATGSGSWPVPGCDPTQTTTHSIRVALDTAACPTTVKSYLTQSLAAVSAAYAEIGLAVRYLLHAGGTAPDCEIRKRFESLSGSVIGWNEFPDPGTCNQTIEGRLDTGYAPSDWRMFANLECHETGHGVGLQHGNGSIMNPSIMLVWPLTWVGTYSYANLKRWFGGEPIGEKPPDPPVPPTGDHNGIVVIDGVLYKSRFWRA